MSSGSADEMAKLYEQITDQKEVIMKCLESEHCDVVALNEQVKSLEKLLKNRSYVFFFLIWTWHPWVCRLIEINI